MAWSLRFARLALLPSLVLGCGHDPDDSCDDVTCGDASTTAASTSGSSTQGTTTTAEGSSTSESSSDSAATTEGSSTAADSTTGAPEPVACGDLVCDPGQACVVPCCGGPKPACFELPPGGDCGTGTLDVDGASCCQNAPDPIECAMLQWCIPGPCIPDPPYCTPGETISCNDSSCTVEGGCYGTLLEDGHLECSCK